MWIKRLTARLVSFSLVEVMKKWLKCAGVRAIKTIAQSALAMMSTAVVLRDVDWQMVLSASVLAGIFSLLTSIAGLPELERDENNDQ